MDAPYVLFVAFEEFDNLGIRYISSVLAGNDFRIRIIDIRKGKKRILEAVRDINPLIIGFSVVYQYYIMRFRETARFLRNKGITSHFCAGGQYASLRQEELYRLMPEIDSVVMFEGELTFLELAKNLRSGTDWKNSEGLAFMNEGRIIKNPLRKPETDLDSFPYPMRPRLQEYALGKKFATLIAGRGCKNNCSFCNNTNYLIKSSFPARRLRRPAYVAGEIEFLHRQNDCSVFLFDDDDFPVMTENGQEWIMDFCAELKHRKLAGRILWKINCRPDEIDYDVFRMMKNHGLYLVFLGIDDGTDEGLARLNKNMTVKQSMTGIRILKKLRINFDYGFMLFQPSSGFDSVLRNIEFLDNLCSDGSAPLKFLKIRPYFETRIEKELLREGRLKGKPGFRDYDFRDPSLNHYYEFLEVVFGEWMAGPGGLANAAFWARNYISVFKCFYKPDARTASIAAGIDEIVAGGNIFMAGIMKELAYLFMSEKNKTRDESDLVHYHEKIRTKHLTLVKQIADHVDLICRIAEIQSISKSIMY